LTESSPLHDQEEKEIDAVEVENSSEFLNLQAAVTTPVETSCNNQTTR